MRTCLSSLRLFEPRSLKEALQLLRDEDALVPMAGCTDIYVLLNSGGLAGTAFLDLWRLDALRGISRRGRSVSMGALTTYAELQKSAMIRARLPMLASAAAQVGGRQVQQRGTIGGNIGNASPAGDVLPVLAALDATVVLRSAAAERRVPINAYFTGYRESVRQHDELIVAVEVPAVEGRQWFRKVGTRQAQAISKVVMAGVRDERPRIAFGSVAPTVVRACATETMLSQGGSIADAQRVLAGEIAPINDVRSTAPYRRQVALNLLARFWAETARA